MSALRALWTDGGLEAVETREIVVQRSFRDFDEFWAISQLGSTVAPIVAALSPSDVELLKSRVRANLPPDSAGRITYSARAHAAKGRVPK
jgi:hypothetical protein